jgi:ribosome recycling factor
LQLKTQKNLVIFFFTKAEKTKENIRLVRKDGVNGLKKLKSSFSEDDIFQSEKEIESLTNSFINKIDEILVLKEKEIMNI